MPKVSELFPQTSGGRRLSDRQFTTNCPQCNRKQNLEEATFTETADDEFHYVCISACGPILIVSTADQDPPEGRGYRLQGWIIRNPRVLWVSVVPGKRPIFMPASPHALD